MDNLALMHDEWEKWQNVVREFADCNAGDINHPENNPLTCAIRLWGEALAMLRHDQDQETRCEAERTAIDDYSRQCEE